MNEVDSMGLFETINAQANAALDELFAAADTLHAGDIFVVGCSTSEVMGKMIGTGSNVDAAKAIMDAILPRSCGALLRAFEPLSCSGTRLHGEI